MAISQAERRRRILSGLMSTLRRLQMWSQRIDIWRGSTDEEVRKLAETIQEGIGHLQELTLLLGYKIEGIDVLDSEDEDEENEDEE